MPSETPTLILRGARFATKRTSLPTSAAGSGYAPRMPLKIVRCPNAPQSRSNFRSFALFGTISQAATRPMRRSSFSKSANATSGLRAGAVEAEAASAFCSARAALFFEARDSWATSPESAGFTFAFSTIASTCFASMRVARYSYLEIAAFSTVRAASSQA